MKKLLAAVLCLIIILSNLPIIYAESEIEGINLLDHDVLPNITVVGSQRISRIPVTVPVLGQPFKRAVAVPAPDDEKLVPTGVSMRLEPNFVAGSAKAGDIVALSLYMKVREGVGYATPSFENKANSVKLIMDKAEIDTNWGKYTFVCEITEALSEIKTTINVGYKGQVTYFADISLVNYGSEHTADEIKKFLLGDDYLSQAEKPKELSREMTEAISGAVVFVNEHSKAYIKDEAVRIDDTSADVMPYMSKNNLYLPVRFAVEKCGGSVIWNNSNSSMILKIGNDAVEIFTDSLMWKFNGKLWRAAEPVQFVGGRAFLSYEVLNSFFKIPSYFDGQKKICVFASDENALNVLKTNNYAATVYDRAVLVAEENYTVELAHDKIKNIIGIPAFIELADAVPSVRFKSVFDASGTYRVYCENQPVGDKKSFKSKENQELILDLKDAVSTLYTGEYRIDFEISIGGSIFYDALYFYAGNSAKRKADDSEIVYRDKSGKLVYIPDFKGNTMPDYSGVGYKNGTAPIPDAPAMIEVKPSGEDDTKQIQDAIDYISALPLRDDGTRGAVQFSKGVFLVDGELAISADGVVLRGAGNDNPNLVDAVPTGAAEKFARENKDTEGTIILLTTKIPESRMLLVSGTAGAVEVNNTSSDVIDSYVPTGAEYFRVEDASLYKAGDEIIIEQTGNLAWVHEIGMDRIPGRTTADANVQNNESSGTNQWGVQTWKFERTVTKIEGNKIYIDYPVAGAIDRKWGGARIYKYTDTGRIKNIGVENMRIVAAWTPNANNVDDTRHAGEFVTVQNAKDCWFRNITTEHLFLYNVNVLNSAKRITVQDFYNLVAPIAYYSGEGYEETGRTFLETGVYVGRYGVYMGGQQVLAQRFYGINMRHLVEYNARTAGPNVTYDAVSAKYFNQMGPHMLWSVAGLYDNTDGALHIQNRLSMGSGHGWAGAWFTAWNCTDRVAVQKPPTAQNWAVGHIGEIHSGDYSQFEQGYRSLQGTRSNIDSIFVAQTEERYGEAGLDILKPKTEFDMNIYEAIEDLSADSIAIDGKNLDEYEKDVYSYTYVLDYGAETPPKVTAASQKYNVEITQVETINDACTVRVYQDGYSQYYKIFFRNGVSPYLKVKANTDDGNIVENVLDGDLQTRWSANGEGQWMMFEVVNPVQIKKLGIAFYNGSARASTFKIEISNDAKNFETIFEGTSSGMTEDVEFYETKPFTAKYIRFTGYGNTTNLWNSVSEFRFYDSAGRELFVK